MRNQDIRELIKTSGVKQWRVAEAYGLSDSHFCRKMRYELSEQEKKRIIEIVHTLSASI